jgi:hypothetical protein
MAFLVLSEVHVVTPFAPPAGLDDVLLLPDKPEVCLVDKLVLYDHAFHLETLTVKAHCFLDDATLLAGTQEGAIVAAWYVRLDEVVLGDCLAFALANALCNHFSL